jgi:uncharacterized protein (DUF608 family)
MSSTPKARIIDTNLEPLFPPDLPARQWLEFPANGFANHVSGAIFTADQPPCCGMPLGGISTGCLDIDPRGVFGFTSIFNPGSLHPEWKNWRYPRRTPDLHPFLGLATGGRTWVLASPEMGSGELIAWCTEPQMQVKPEGITLSPPDNLRSARIEGVSYPTRITYFGHYPVADMEFETDAPLAVGLRAWAPFIPGDAASSNIPGILFEVTVRNPSEQHQTGTLALSFAGPDANEARSTEFTRREVCEDFRGMLVGSRAGVQYLLGTTDPANVRFGASLNRDPKAWPQIATTLPQPYARQDGVDLVYQEGSCAAAVDFDLAAHSETTIRFILAWYAPEVEGARKTFEDGATTVGGFMHNRWVGSRWSGNAHTYTQMYASRFGSALDVARCLATQHTSLLARILAWQSAIYADITIPAWLRDALVNNLGLIAEDSHWFQPKPPLGEEVFPLGGFALNESPRGCPHMACIPCDWYGNLPIVFFFPELAHSTLKLFKAYQRDDGEIPFALGKIADLPDLASPEYYWQVSLNGMCYVDLVDRLWQRTGDDAILREFYESVKHCNTFTMNLRRGPGGPISMPEIGGMEWFEFGEWAGMATHLGGLRLAELRMMQRMAEAVGDGDYVECCREWFAEGSSAMEEEMWAGNYYLNFWEPSTGKRSDDVMGYQLDGEWTARYHGLPGVFQKERVLATLDTIRRCNIALTPEVGAANFCRPDGSPLSKDSKVAHYGQYAMFCPEMVLLAMTYLYAGESDFGLDLARKGWESLCLKQGYMWDLPNNIHGDTGQRVFGTDYYQNMLLWALPAAVTGVDLKTSCKTGGLIDAVMRAGEKK